VSHRFPIERAAEAYEAILGESPSLGVLLQYPGAAAGDVALAPTVQVAPRVAAVGGAASVGFIGAGAYASRVLVPAFQRAGAQLKVLASASGASAGIAARKHGVPLATSDKATVLEDPDVGAVVIATRHDSHAGLVCDALVAGKHVFVEKPLALSEGDLARVQAACERAGGLVVMVGFNRRFSPHAQRMKELLAGATEPRCFVMTVNAGEVAVEHWTQDRETGGGRLAGEACHFIDLIRFLAGSAISTVHAQAIGAAPGVRVRDDKATITLGFADGSMGTIHYFANGHRAFPKERLEVFCAGRILQLDNFRKLRGWGWSGFSSMGLWRQDKGQQRCVEAFLAAVAGKTPAPIPFDELIEVSRATIEAAAQAAG
jgi:predicted dehydrogenase